MSPGRVFRFRGSEFGKETLNACQGEPSMKVLVLLLMSTCIFCRGVRADVAPEVVDVTPVWSGHPVGFCLLTRGEKQFVAFYDAERNMTVASRILDSTEWVFVRLSEKVGWDSHNSITMALDDDERIHLTGNMHCVPLVYFRTREPLDITTFERVERMVGERESRCTYPRFMRGVNNEFIFTYRDGSSGNGDQIYNVYDHETQQWKRLLDKPLLSGMGKMNAYMHGPVKGPDGLHHLCWVWRDASGCEMNHDLSYARSPDLIHWETSSGVPLELPMTIENAEIVDPVPIRGGMINGNTRLGFDSRNRPVISYHKFDEQGLTQAYNARLEDGTWAIYQVSNWDYRWDFRGGGTIIFEIRVSGIRTREPGRLSQTFSHVKYGSREWIFDEETFSVLEERETSPGSAKPSMPVETDPAKLEKRSCGDSGRPDTPSVRYTLQWETLPQNRDKPRESDIPPPSMLRVVKTGN